MTDIQRYAVDGYGNVHKTSRRDEYAWLVSYYDHVEALRQAEQRVIPNAWNAGWREGIRAARDAVAALQDPVPGVERNYWTISEVLAAIDALKGESNE